MNRSQKGFTLVEMLVVIAIIAILVAMLVPTVMGTTKKAQAAADAANLKITLDMMNTQLLDHNDIEEIAKEVKPAESKYAPGARIRILYTKPCFVDTYYVDPTGHYYGIKYLADIASNGNSKISIGKPVSLGEWYEAGTGALINPETGK